MLLSTDRPRTHRSCSQRTHRAAVKPQRHGAADWHDHDRFARGSRARVLLRGRKHPGGGARGRGVSVPGRAYIGVGTLSNALMPDGVGFLSQRAGDRACGFCGEGDGARGRVGRALGRICAASGAGRACADGVLFEDRRDDVDRAERLLGFLQPARFSRLQDLFRTWVLLPAFGWVCAANDAGPARRLRVVSARRGA